MAHQVGRPLIYANCPICRRAHLTFFFFRFFLESLSRMITLRWWWPFWTLAYVVDAGISSLSLRLSHSFTLQRVHKCYANSFICSVSSRLSLCRKEQEKKMLLLFPVVRALYVIFRIYGRMSVCSCMCLSVSVSVCVPVRVSKEVFRIKLLVCQVEKGLYAGSLVLSVHACAAVVSVSWSTREYCVLLYIYVWAYQQWVWMDKHRTWMRKLCFM